MIILGIESTCDETGCAIVKDGREILANVVTSQIDLHEQYGGVVPELACRRHIDVMIPVIKEALEEANVTLADIDLIAVANGPGLIGALLLGVHAAKSLSLAWNIPLIGINHIEAHLYAAIMSHPEEDIFPALGVVLSGGHTSLVKMDNIGCYQSIGNTIDDAIGEAFDKVARLLDLPYPGGPQVERLAKDGDPSRYSLTAGRVKGRPFDFSFSGLKTGVLYAVKGQNGQKESESKITLSQKNDIAASFQKTAVEDVVSKTLNAAKNHQCKSLIFGGGVTNNQYLRDQFQLKGNHCNQYWPSSGLSLDNAAMIAGLAFHRAHIQGADDLNLEAITRIGFNDTRST